MGWGVGGGAWVEIDGVKNLLSFLKQFLFQTFLFLIRRKFKKQDLTSLPLSQIKAPSPFSLF